MGKINKMLSPTQIKARDQVIEKMVSGEYTLGKNSCLCGKSNDVTLASEERYGIPIKTVLCLECGLVRSDPYYDEKSLANFYADQYRPLYSGEAKATENFFSEEMAFGGYIHDFMAEKIFKGEIKDKKIFEVGCGAGGILGTFRKKGNQVYGCDYGKSYLEFGRGVGLNLVEGDSSSLKEFGTADIVILNHSLEHMTKPIEELRVIRELLLPAGILYIALPGIYFIHETYRGNFKQYLQNAHVWYFTLKTLNATLARAGFELISGSEEIIAVYKKTEPRVMPPEEKALNILRYVKKMKRFGWFYALKKFSIRHSAFETLRRVRPLYNLTRTVYRKIKTKK